MILIRRVAWGPYSRYAHGIRGQVPPSPTLNRGTEGTETGVHANAITINAITILHLLLMPLMKISIQQKKQIFLYKRLNLIETPLIFSKIISKFSSIFEKLIIFSNVIESL